MYCVFININIIILKLHQLVPSGFPVDLNLHMYVLYLYVHMNSDMSTPMSYVHEYVQGHQNWRTGILFLAYRDF